MSKETGGPAFPTQINNSGITPIKGFNGEEIKPQTFSAYPGMNLRDFFAAHAPSNPPAWFEPVMDSPEPAFNGVRDEETMEFITTNEDEIQAWKVERYKQQAIQWPYAWADLMLAARVKP
ncbi:hypothetical protein AA098_10170 [Pseudomonas sp. JY-Q]|nr:hypothetical protein AA098_10170 [Pseudomonas sp. JY-Q]